MFYNVGIDIGKEELDVFFNNKSYKFKNNTKGIEMIVNSKKIENATLFSILKYKEKN